MDQQNVNNFNRRPEGGPNRIVNCPIDLDILERIKREAHHKKMSHKVLLNRILREAVFKTKLSKKEERLLDHPFCPQCKFNLLNGKIQKENSKTATSNDSKQKRWSNLWGLLQ